MHDFMQYSTSLQENIRGMESQRRKQFLEQSQHTIQGCVRYLPRSAIMAWLHRYGALT